MEKKEKQEKEVPFEEAMKRLEEIVSRLETGDRPLEESLKLFEEGIKLVKDTNQVLSRAEQKVELLVKNQAGKVTGSQPFEEAEKEAESEQ
jgi:exodeoxyribonuclease VII small subunit